MNINPFLLTDGYKTGHHLMYPEGTSLVYSNFTPRSNKYAPKGCDKVVSFGQQMVVRMIKESFDEYFFKRPKDEVCQEVKREYSLYLNTDYDVSHIESLWELGYLPIKVKSLPEGTLVPMGVPVLTIHNTLPEFYWLTNFLETLISNLLWKPMTSATIAHQYRKTLKSWAEKTDPDNIGFVDFQGHDFSMRGMDSPLASMTSGLGHATSFLGSDSLPVIYGARKYYGDEGFVVGSVNATEHSVMCAGTKDDEIGTFRYLMNQFPTGILSVVSDTWNLWDVITKYLPELKEEILARDGKLVIRPDSGDPVDIICGTQKFYKLHAKISNGYETTVIRNYYDPKEVYFDGTNYYKVEVIGSVGLEKCTYKFWRIDLDSPEKKGVIELLWDLFGGTTNEQGYKVLDPHIGAIYGDSITIERAEEICKRLEAKGFASTNIVLGVGSFTYQFNTRDTFGFAMKATYVEVETEDGTEGRPIFKDPVTDDGTKKSAKGLLGVFLDHEGEYALEDEISWTREGEGSLQTIFMGGHFGNQVTLDDVRKRLM